MKVKLFPFTFCLFKLCGLLSTLPQSFSYCRGERRHLVDSACNCSSDEPTHMPALFMCNRALCPMQKPYYTAAVCGRINSLHYDRK